MPQVSWAVLNGHQVETIAAVLLANRYPASVRIRPSQGDGGLDVLVPTGDQMPGPVVDYQVKLFSSNLGPAQKRQIRKSLSAAIATHHAADNEWSIEEWYLTLPLNATKEQIAWLQDTARELAAPFPCAWRGLDFLDGLAADFPAVIDYYLNDGEARLAQALHDMRALAQLDARAGAGPLVPADVTGKLSDLRSSLNRYDPHYRYDIELTQELPQGRDTVAVSTVLSDHECVTFHVYPRYVEAPVDRPITTTFTVDIAGMTEELRAQWQRAMRYGTAVELPPDAIREVTINMPGGLGFSGPAARLRLGSTHSDPTAGAKLRWALLPPEGVQPLAQLVMTMQPATVGPEGGKRVVGHDETGLAELELLFAPLPEGEPDAPAPFTISFKLEAREALNRSVHEVVGPLRFAAAWASPNRLWFGPQFGPLRAAAAFEVTGEPMMSKENVDYVDALRVVSEHSGVPIPMPGFGRPAADTLSAVQWTAAVLTGETVGLPADEPRVAGWVEPSALETVLSLEPVEFRTTYGLTVTLDGTTHPLPDAELLIPAVTYRPIPDAGPSPEGLIPVEIVFAPGAATVRLA